MVVLPPDYMTQYKKPVGGFNLSLMNQEERKEIKWVDTAHVKFVLSVENFTDSIFKCCLNKAAVTFQYTQFKNKNGFFFWNQDNAYPESNIHGKNNCKTVFKNIELEWIIFYRERNIDKSKLNLNTNKIKALSTKIFSEAGLKISSIDVVTLPYGDKEYPGNLFPRVTPIPVKFNINTHKAQIFGIHCPALKRTQLEYQLYFIFWSHDLTEYDIRI